MSRLRSLALRLAAAGLVGLALALSARAAGIDPVDAKLPAGWTVTRPGDLGAAELKAIGKRLGAPLRRGRNAILSLNGFPAQVNWIQTEDEDGAKTIEAALRKMRGPDYVVRDGPEVIEVAGTDLLAARAVLNGLGLRKDAQATYEVEARLALVDQGDDDHANDVFNLFLERAKDPVRAEQLGQEITAAVKGWTFGKSLAVAASKPGWFTASWSFTPEPKSRRREGDREVLTFEDPPTELGIPYVDARATITVTERFSPSGASAAETPLGATARWPVDAKAVKARVVAAGGQEPETTVLALLRHISKTIRYAGPEGSRHGVLAVLSQGFGRCWDESDVFVTLARAAGIPAREVAGWVPPLGQGHVWAEVRLGDKGWIPVDATTTWLGTGEDYVPFFVTDDGEMPILYLTMPNVHRVY